MANKTRKRKTNHSVEDDNKKISRKEVRHLEDFGEEHPIKDKIDFEDRFAKRIYEDEEQNSPTNGKTNIKDDSELNQSEPDYYEELMNVFGKKKDVAPESDDDDEELQSSETKINLSDKSYEDLDREENLNDEYEEDLQSDNEQTDLKSKDTTNEDNFVRHFFHDFESSDIDLLKNNQSKSNNFPHQWPQLGSFVETKINLDKFNLIPLNDRPAVSLDQIQLKPRIKENISKSMLDITQGKHHSLTSFQMELLTLLQSYKNLYYPERTFENGEQIRLVYSAHSLNHILKTRSRIISHNSKIAQLPSMEKEYRDQGLTRPKVLIILPFRESALRTVNCMINLLFGDQKDSLEKKIHLMNYKRFKKEFGPDENQNQEISSRKPDDYKQLFAGNIDDSFRVGISLTKKSLKLYADFYSSDIIIASPLGLRLIIGAQGESERDFDFLSSIELVIFDQADVFMMQNWEHVLHIMQHLHLKPHETHGVDFSRVKLWILELWSKFYYQLVMFTSVSGTMLTGFFNKYSTSFAGKILFRNEIPRSLAAVNQVYIQCPQIFHRFDCPSFSESSNRRFEFFIKKILPKFRDPMMVRTMIFIPSYFDFVRLRNHFRREDLSFVQICEYSKEGKVAKARHIFFYGGRHFMLYTERFHFFHRCTIKAIRHLIFYEPPLYPHFYSEMVNAMNRANQGQKMLTDYSSMSVTVLYNRFDLHSLVRLVGTTAALKLTSNDQTDSDVHMFLTENVVV